MDKSFKVQKNSKSQMDEKIILKVGFIISLLLASLFVYSAFMKLLPTKELIDQSLLIGIDKETYFFLGVVELISVLLFLSSRTGILGSLLLTSYMGGAIATHIEHGQSILFPCLVQVALFITTYFRFPQLRKSILS